MRDSRQQGGALVLQNNLAFDVLRGFTIVVAGALMIYTGGLVLHWRKVPYDFGRKLRYLALFGYAVMTAMEEYHQIGRPFVFWRCPLLLVTSLAALLGMMLPDIDTWKDRPRWWDFDTPADKYNVMEPELAAVDDDPGS